MNVECSRESGCVMRMMHDCYSLVGTNLKNLSQKTKLNFIRVIKWLNIKYIFIYNL